MLAQHDELTADAADCFAVVFAEVGDGLEIGHQTPGQPHQFDIAVGLFLKAPARLNPIQVAVDIQFQQHGWVVSRPTGGGGIDALKPQLAEIQFVNEGIDDAHRIGLRNVVVEQLWQ